MKNKGVAIILAIFLGSFGIHDFYLGRTVKGVFMFLFVWTLIPSIIAIIDILILAFMDKNNFNLKYNA